MYYRRKTRTRGLAMEDRISQLPDNILCHILTFLPTRSAIGTCVLSKRWYRVWTGIPVLDFTDPPNSIIASEYTLSEEQYISLKRFVNRILLLSDASPLERVDLDVYEIFKSKDLRKWFIALRRRRIKELNIFCKLQKETIETRMQFPRPIKLPLMSLFSGIVREQIVVLRLSGSLCLSLQVSLNSILSLPCLEILHFKEIKFIANDDRDDPFVYLLSECPSLRELVFDNCEGMHMCVCCSSNRLDYPFTHSMDTTVIVTSPNLEYLEIADCFTSYETDYLPSLVEAKVSIHARFFTECMERLERLRNVRALSLLVGETYDEDYIDYNQLEVFQNLTCLEVRIYRWPFLLLLVRLLRHMPNLASLTINKIGTVDIGWHWPDDEPECVGLPLEYMEFRNVTGSEVGFEIVRFFLSCCMALKEVKVHLASQMSLENKYEALKQLLKLPRASRCEITISEI